MIQCSREKSILPASLQGIWNDKVVDVPWMSDYHMNINLQMNYWPVFVTNLIGVESNEKNPENGFMVHTQNTPFSWTCPGWDFS